MRALEVCMQACTDSTRNTSVVKAVRRPAGIAGFTADAVPGAACICIAQLRAVIARSVALAFNIAGVPPFTTNLSSLDLLHKHTNAPSRSGSAAAL